jgi:2-dehydropantoate 2-reductase
MKDAENKLKVLCFGAGAIGTYIGGSLALSGHEVVFLERPKFDPSTRPEITLHLARQPDTINKPVIKTDIAEISTLPPFDVALFALKSFDTDTALKQIAPYAEHMPPFLCLQNGIDNEGKLAAVLGENKVIPATVTSAIGKKANGEIVLEKLRGVGISAQHPLSQTLFDHFAAANLNPLLLDDSQSMKWSKMLTNLIANASSAILGMLPSQIFADPGLSEIELMQIREILTVMKKKGIKVVNLPGTPVKVLTGIYRYLPAFISRPILKKAVAGGRGDKMPSFYIDLHSGRAKSEVDFLNGAVVRAGSEIGIPTPANHFLNSTLLKLVAKQIPSDTYTGAPEKFLQDFAIFKS